MNTLPDKVYIEKSVKNHPLTKKILNKLNDVEQVLVEDYKTIGMEKEYSVRAMEDKKCLALAEKKGDVLKSIGRMEEGQYYLFHEIDCKYDCEYCYLQYYFQTKTPTIFVNRDEVLTKIEEILRNHENPYFHAGEVCDALAFDYITGFSKDIIELFNKYPNGKIEFRTKSLNIENLLSAENGSCNVIPSWTMSPPYINKTIEHGTPGLTDRINAAKKCQDAGYTVGVRLDPVFVYENWETDYKLMVHQILNVLDPLKIDYISIGSIKLHKNLLDAIRKRFPSSPVILGEIVPAMDGKYRYMKFKRVEMYKKFINWIKEISPDIKVDLSLESEDVKELVFS